MALQIYELNIGGPITAHAFNADRTKLAISKNSNTVEIYTVNGSSVELTDTLVDHDKLVTSIDWAPSSNRIVTCSQDRNANVWTFDATTGRWKPTLVLLRINRGATSVKWSPKEDKFAVASSARLIAVCYFEPQNDWWISKHLKKPIRSTVLCLDWHPNNVLLAAGSTDMHARVFSAFIKDVDAKPEPSSWGTRLPFGTLVLEHRSRGWVHDIHFSPPGDSVAWVSHDCGLYFSGPPAAEGTPSAPVKRVLVSLPMMSFCFTGKNSIVAAGHNCAPVLFTSNADGEWKMTGSVDEKANVKKDDGGDQFKTLRNSFRDMDVKGGSEDTTLPTVHQNTITQVSVYEGRNGRVTAISTSGVDGRLVIWKV